MSKKFTEEQYREIVKAWEKTYDYVLSVKNVIETVESFGECYDFQIGEALALANAVSSDWVHEQFVEKEKKYVWTSKKTVTLNGNGVENYRRLFRTLNGDISGVLKEKDEDVYEEEYLTETEVREWGYNPEMFDKEEV